MKKLLRALWVLSLLGTVSSCGENISPERITPSRGCNFSLTGRTYSCPVLDDIRIIGSGVSLYRYELFLEFGTDSTVTVGYSYTFISKDGESSSGVIERFYHGSYQQNGYKVEFGGIVIPDLRSILHGEENDGEKSCGSPILDFGTINSKDSCKMECLFEDKSVPEGSYLVRDFMDCNRN